jgi:2-iminobutanoate/2-iminopropanoate deaminase
MKKEIVDVDKGLSSTPLSAAVKAGGFVFISGTPPREPGNPAIPLADVKRQTELVLDGIKRRLEASGSSLDKVVKCTVYVTNAAYFDIVNTVYRTYFPVDPPARTFVTVGSWPWPFDIEIDCIAIAGD